MVLVKGTNVEHQRIIDHRSGCGRYDFDHIVADHGNGPCGCRERDRSVDELYDLGDHFRTRTRFRTDWATALVPEREAFGRLVSRTDRSRNHPAASRSGVARNKAAIN